MANIYVLTERIGMIANPAGDHFMVALNGIPSKPALTAIIQSRAYTRGILRNAGDAADELLKFGSFKFTSNDPAECGCLFLKQELSNIS